MKKIIIVIFALLLISGCVSVNNDKRLTDLENKVAKMQNQVSIVMAQGTGASFMPFHGIDGNAAGDLDHVAGGSISLLDVAFVVFNEDATYGNAVFIYTYMDYGGAVSELLPYIVKPASNPNANYAWTLAGGSTAPAVTITSTPYSITVGEVRAGFARMTVTGQVNLPDAATVGFGTPWCVVARDAEVITVNPDDSDKIFVPGVGVQAIGVSTTSDGAIGDYACFISDTDTDGSGTDGWWMLGYGLTAWNAGS